MPDLLEDFGRRRRTAKQGPNVWVVHYKGRFSIKEEGTRVYLVPPIPQRIAVLIARLIARANHSELIVQGEKGRIHHKDSHGADTYPPKG